MKKITLVSLGTTGAGPVYSLEMAKALASSQRCYLQVIISTEVKNIDQWDLCFKDRDDIEYHVIDTYKHNILSVIYSSLFDLKKKRHLIDLICQFKTDILYIPFKLTWAKDIYYRLNNIRIITTIHDPHPHDSFLQGFKWYIFDNFIGNECIGRTNDIIVLNKKDVEFVKYKYKKNVIVIPHASFSYYIKKEDNHNYKLQHTIGFFGRIEPYKGLDILIDAFERLYDINIKLLVAGSGQIDSILKNRIERNSNIVLYNRYIEDEEIQSLLQSVDFVVLPYKRASQSGVIPLSFALGKTVVATNVGALDEQVPKGTGVLVEPNVESIEKAIRELYGKPNLITEMGIRAKNYADTELTWEHSAELLLDYLNNMD